MGDHGRSDPLIRFSEFDNILLELQDEENHQQPSRLKFQLRFEQTPDDESLFNSFEQAQWPKNRKERRDDPNRELSRLSWRFQMAEPFQKIPYIWTPTHAVVDLHVRGYALAGIEQQDWEDAIHWEDNNNTEPRSRPLVVPQIDPPQLFNNTSLPPLEGLERKQPPLQMYRSQVRFTLPKKEKHRTVIWRHPKQPQISNLVSSKNVPTSEITERFGAIATSHPEPETKEPSTKPMDEQNLLRKIRPKVLEVKRKKGKKDASQQTVKEAHSIFANLNPTFSNMEWLNSVLWDDELVEEFPSASLILDLNDPYLLLERDSKQNLQRQTDRKETVSPSPEDDERQDIESKVKDTLDEDENPSEPNWNISNDGFYKTPKPSSHILERVDARHAERARKLARDWFKPGLSGLDLERFHRPLLDIRGANSNKRLVDVDGKSRVKLSLKLTDQPEIPLKVPNHIIPFPQPIVITQRMTPKKIGNKELSARDGHIILFEYLEQHPPLVSNRGMASKIRTYYRTNEDHPDPPQQTEDEGEYINLKPLDKSPFVAEIKPGLPVTALHNNLYIAPVARHRAPETDFLLVRQAGPPGSPQTFQWYIREIPSIYVVGQTQSKTRVPAPGSKQSRDHWKDRLQVFIHRELNKKGKIQIGDVTSIFGAISDQPTRKILQGLARYERKGDDPGYWTPLPNVEQPTDEQIKAKCTPEKVCEYESMQAAQNRLKLCGIKTMKYPSEVSRLIPNLKEDIKEVAQFIEEKLLAVPWVLTDGFVSHMEGKAMMELKGRGNPLGRGYGFGYIPDAKRPKDEDGQIELLGAPKQVTGTEADLRKLSMTDLKKELMKFGVSERDVDGMTRWVRVRALREKATSGVRSGQRMDVKKWARAEKVTSAQQQEKYMKRVREVFERQMNLLRTDSNVVANSVGTGTVGTTALTNALQSGTALEGARLPLLEEPDVDVDDEDDEDKETARQKAAQKIEEDKIMTELIRKAAGGGASPAAGLSASGGRTLPSSGTPVTGAGIGQGVQPFTTVSPGAGLLPTDPSQLDAYNQAPKKTRKREVPAVKRTTIRTNPDGTQEVIVQYYKEDQLVCIFTEGGEEALRKALGEDTKENKEGKEGPKPSPDEEKKKKGTKRSARPPKDKGVKRTERGKKRLERRQRELIERHKNAMSGIVDDDPKGNKNQKIKCGSCGMVGHMRTNRNCPKFQEFNDVNNIAYEDAGAAGLVQVSDDGKLKLNTSKILEKTAEDQREMEKKARKRAGGSSLPPSLMGRKRGADWDPQSRDGSAKRGKFLQRRRGDPLIKLSTLFEEVLLGLIDLPESAEFRYPVNPKKVPDYLTVVKHPMDLNTMLKTRVRDPERTYRAPSQFLGDLKLILENCKLYNGPTSILTDAANRLFRAGRDAIHAKKGELNEIEVELKRDQLERDLLTSINIMRKADENKYFHLPVKNIPDYPEKVKHPMDFKTLEERINSHRYDGPRPFMRDLWLVYSNSVLYNGKDHYVTKSAEKAVEAGRLHLSNVFKENLTFEDVINSSESNLSSHHGDNHSESGGISMRLPTPLGHEHGLSKKDEIRSSGMMSSHMNDDDNGTTI